MKYTIQDIERAREHGVQFFDDYTRYTAAA